MITGEDIEIICGLCNSILYRFYLSKILSGDSYQYGSGNFFQNLPLIKIDDEKAKEQLKKAVTEIQTEYTDKKAERIDKMIFDLYKLTDVERNAISFIEIE